MPPPSSLSNIPTPDSPLVDPNLLEVPQKTDSNETTSLTVGTTAALGSFGIYMGEGLPPVSDKIADKIRAWKFVDMAELLPEPWGAPSLMQEGPSTSQERRKSKKKVTDIVTWLECFAMYVGVMAGAHPKSVPELMAYMITILRTSQDFEDPAWITYDLAFRRQAAATNNRQWSRLNPTLYSICTAGKARKVTRCELCLNSDHTTKECASLADSDPDVGTRVKAIESVILAMSGQTPTGTGNHSRQPRGLPPICQLFNRKRCWFRRCKFRHVCMICGGDKPAVECCRKLGQLNKAQAPAHPNGSWSGQAIRGHPY